MDTNLDLTINNNLINSDDINETDLEELVNNLEILCRCPISSALFMKPVVADDGYIYEESTISEYLDQYDKRSPMNRQHISKNYRNINIIKSIINKLVSYKKELADEIFFMDLSYENNKKSIINIIYNLTGNHTKLLAYNKFKLFDTIGMGQTGCNCNDCTQNTKPLFDMLITYKIEPDIMSHIILNAIDLNTVIDKRLEIYVCQYCTNINVINHMHNNGYFNNGYSNTNDTNDTNDTDTNDTDTNNAPLLLACKYNNLPLIELIINYDTNKKNMSTKKKILNILRNNSDILDTLINNTNISVIKKFIEYGLQYNKPIINGEYLIHMACEHSNTPLIKYLLTLNTDITILYEESAPFDIYIDNSGEDMNIDIVTQFISIYDKLNYKINDDSITMLLYNACKFNKLDIVQTLYDNNKITTKIYLVPDIFFTILENNNNIDIDIYKYLVDKGVDILVVINTVNQKQSLLYKALKNKSTTLVKYLLTFDTIMDDDKLFKLIIKYIPSLDIIKQFIEKGCKINNSHMNYIINGDKRILEYVLSILDNIDFEINGKKLIYIVLEKVTDFNIVKLCVDKLCIDKLDSLVPDENNWYPVHYAIRYQQPEIIQYIIDITTNLDKCVTNDGYTVMHFACLYSTQDIIYYLLFDKQLDIQIPVTTYNGKNVEYSCINLIEINNKIKNNDKDILISTLFELSNFV